jgi:hypothetical protein
VRPDPLLQELQAPLLLPDPGVDSQCQTKREAEEEEQEQEVKELEQI